MRFNVFNETILGVVNLSADFAEVQNGLEVLRHVFEDEIFLAVISIADGTDIELLLVEV